MAPQTSSPAPLLLLSRVLLLVAVLTGLGAMHVLDTASGAGHGSMPATAAASAAMTAPMTTASPATPPGAALGHAVSSSGAGDHGLVAGCVLFAASGVALLGALLTAAAAHHRRHPAVVPPLHGLLRAAGAARHGPPPRPRIALCVIRT